MCSKCHCYRLMNAQSHSIRSNAKRAQHAPNTNAEWHILCVLNKTLATPSQLNLAGPDFVVYKGYHLLHIRYMAHSFELGLYWSWTFHSTFEFADFGSMCACAKLVFFSTTLFTAIHCMANQFFVASQLGALIFVPCLWSCHGCECE